MTESNLNVVGVGDERGVEKSGGVAGLARDTVVGDEGRGLEAWVRPVVDRMLSLQSSACTIAGVQQVLGQVIQLVAELGRRYGCRGADYAALCRAGANVCRFVQRVAQDDVPDEWKVGLVFLPGEGLSSLSEYFSAVWSFCVTVCVTLSSSGGLLATGQVAPECCLGTVVGDGAVVVARLTGAVCQRSPYVAFVTESMYRGMLVVGNREEGGTCRVSFVKNVDGVYALKKEYDVAQSCVWSSLPEGRYRLPGLYGVVVSGAFVRSLFAHVHVFPRSLRDGWCYLRAVDVEARVSAFVKYGAYPVSEALDVDVRRGSVPHAGTGSVVHVEDLGPMPVVPPGVRVGGDDPEGNRPSRVRTLTARKSQYAHLRSAVDVAFQGFSGAVGSAVAGAVSAYPFDGGGDYLQSQAVEVPLASTVEELRLARGATRAVQLRGVDGVPVRRTSSVGFNGRGWAEALASGAVLGDDGFAKLVETKGEGEPALSSGRTLLLATEMVGDAVNTPVAVWKSRSLGVQDWAFQVLEQVGAVLVVPPAEGVMVRYEFDVVGGEVTIGGEYVFEPGGTVVWSDRPFVVVPSGRRFRAWRAWCDSGARVSGTEVGRMSQQLGVVAVAGVGWLSVDRLRVLSLSSVGQVVREDGVKRYAVESELSAGESALCLVAPFSGARLATEVVVRSRDLSWVRVAGVSLKAVGGVVRFVTDGLTRPLSVSVRSRVPVAFAVSQVSRPVEAVSPLVAASLFGH